MTSFKIPKIRGQITLNRIMADLSWLRVGGSAEVFFQPADLDDLQDFLLNIPLNVPILPIGVCSNLIIRDGGIKGVVVRMGRGFNEIKILENSQLRVGCAALDAHVARKAAKLGIDLAFLRTIPGAIGGAVKMNAGCYGTYISDVFVSADVITRQGERLTLYPNDMEFGYRSTNLAAGMIITSVVFQGQNRPPDLIEEKMQIALMKREESQPTKERSCGSTFRNPAGFSSTGKADDSQNLKAWKVIDDAGLRGEQLGGAQISIMHPNFLINTGGATAEDLENLGEIVRKKVFKNCGIELVWEIMRVGEFAK